MKYIFIILIGLGFIFTANAQSTLTSADPFYQEKLDRYRVVLGENTPLYHSNFRPVNMEMASELLSRLDSTYTPSTKDQFLIDYLKNDLWFFMDSTNNESAKPLLNHFYKNKTDLYHVDDESIKLRINPVFYFSAGRDPRNSTGSLFINTRAAEVRAIIDDKVGFYTFLSENQLRFPSYVQKDYISQYGALPGEGFFKPFKDGGYDFFNARGYIDFNATEHINIQFGHERFRIGQGIRSVLLDTHAPPYLFLKFQTRVWKFNYTNLFGQLIQERSLVPAGLNGAGRYPNKYMALHHLSFNIGKKVNIGFYEAIMTGANDGSTGQLQLKYLNPIVFYRSIEHQNGSADNVMVGADAEWLIAPGLSLYGQFMLDEFKLENIREGNGWWANKYGALLNLKYMNAFGVDQLDITLEGSQVRPYTYAHYTPFGSFSHYQQPLAHIRGSNFREVMVDISWMPLKKLFLQSRVIWGEYGTDENGNNWGGNILMDYTTRVQEFDNEIAQGEYNTSLFADITASYMLKQGLFFDLKYIYRNREKDNPSLPIREANRTDHLFQGSLRLNIAQRRNEF